MPELVRYEVGGDVATITLDSPHNRNALSAQLVSELSARLAEAGEDPAARAVVLTHTGRVFCAGADLKAAGAGSTADSSAAVMALLTAIPSCPSRSSPGLRDTCARAGWASWAHATWPSRPRARPSRSPRRGSAWLRP